MKRSFNWTQTKWQYIGWSNVDWKNIPGKQFVVMTVRGMVISLLERHRLMSDTQLSQYMHSEMGYPMSLKAVRNHLKALERYGLVRSIPATRTKVVKVKPETKHLKLKPKTLQPSHFMDAAFLTKGRVTQHNRTRLGIVIVAVLEVKRDRKGNTTRGRKFAYVFRGKTETTNDLINALDLARRHQQVTCIQTDRRPLYRSKKFQSYLLKNNIDIIQKKGFGAMIFIDGMFGHWKNKYVHP
ncbi:hypothetical protein GTO27_01300, partial [Candidatus Bathyarchaeota archaeon]|nr:hypothetical protein [Candidatus Bathyarchaeota archaeon]